ncbi:peptidoglycan recognition family protein [Anaerolentibacter hominis]|uniref:peptidoglycan recognition protein family protein n=1 Tax=Anaerolentibacter hominis TaxID=3079009 RepID=UPI0031B8142C
MRDYEPRGRKRRRIRHNLKCVAVLCCGLLILVLCGKILMKLNDHLEARLASADETKKDDVLPETAPFDTEKEDEIEIPDWITQDILPLNEYSRPGDKLEAVNGVVVHYTGNPGTTAEQNRSYFAYLAQTHETSASSHFVIGIDGTIIQCVPLDEISYCSNSRNIDTIAIECCHGDESGSFTQATYDSLVRLTSWLCETFDLSTEEVIRHYDVTGKKCPKYYVDNEDAWLRFLDELEEYTG